MPLCCRSLPTAQLVWLGRIDQRDCISPDHRSQLLRTKRGTTEGAGTRRWPAPLRHGRRSPQRLAGGMVPAAPGARPSWAIACTRTEALSVAVAVRGNGTRDERAETISLKFNRLFAETGCSYTQPRHFGHFASQEIATSGTVAQCSGLAANDSLVGPRRGGCLL